MYIKLLDGRNAGEVRDIQNEAAAELLRQGRAKSAFVEEEQIPPRVRVNADNTEPRLRADAVPGLNIEPPSGRSRSKSKSA